MMGDDDDDEEDLWQYTLLPTQLITMVF